MTEAEKYARSINDNDFFTDAEKANAIEIRNQPPIHLTEAQKYEANLIKEEEGLSVGYGEDLLLGAVGGAAANIIGKPALHLLGKVPGAKKAVKAVEGKIDDAIDYIDDKLPSWMGSMKPVVTGKERATIDPHAIKKSKPSDGITTPYPNEALRTTVNYRNNVLKNGEQAEGVKHIDPRWYDKFQDTKSVRLGGGKEDDLLTRSMLSRLSPINKTKDDLLLDIRKIEEAKKVMVNKKGLPWKANKTLQPDGSVGSPKKVEHFDQTIADARTKVIDDELKGLYAKANNAGGNLGNAVKTIPAAAITGGMFGPAAGGTALLLPYGAKMSEQFLKTRARDNYVKTLFNKAGITKSSDISPYLERPVSRAIGGGIRRGTVGGIVGGTANVGKSMVFPDGSTINEDGTLGEVR